MSWIQSWQHFTIKIVWNISQHVHRLDMLFPWTMHKNSEQCIKISIIKLFGTNRGSNLKKIHKLQSSYYSEEWFVIIHVGYIVQIL